MKTLFIVGNGFDLMHGLPTGYFNLKNYIQRTRPSLYEQINRQLFTGNDDLWSSFEENVGTDDSYFDTEFTRIMDEVSADVDEMNGGASPLDGDISAQIHDASYEIWNYISDKLEGSYNNLLFENLYENFLSSLRELLLSVDITSYGINKNDIFKDYFDKHRDKEFITFNYTHTLERCYQVVPEKIFHVHGELSADAVLDRNTILFGNKFEALTSLDVKAFHIPDKEYAEYLNEIANYAKFSEEEIKNYDSRGLNYDYGSFPNLKNIDLSEYISRYNESKETWVKEVNIDGFEEFLGTKDFDKISIVGHSFGEVDQEYFQILNEKYPSAMWDVFVYEPDNMPNEVREIVSLLFPQKSINYISLK